MRSLCPSCPRNQKTGLLVFRGYERLVCALRPGSGCQDVGDRAVRSVVASREYSRDDGREPSDAAKTEGRLQVMGLRDGS